jgi:hypothetical protein
MWLVAIVLAGVIVIHVMPGSPTPHHVTHVMH